MKKHDVKKYLMKSMDLCFEKLYEMLSPTSNFYNDVIHLKMRYQRITDEQHKGTVSAENRNLELNKIQLALIEFIDKLQEIDFDDSNTVNSQNTLSNENKLNHFWKSFFNYKTTIVIGTYYGERFRAWEASTLMAAGDAIALGTMMGVLNNVGIKDIDVVPTYNFSGDRYQNNLILLGGPDANKLTREVYNKLETNFRFGNPDKNEITLYDSKEKMKYSPKYNSNNEVVGDYGFAFKSKNPFNPETDVIILAGCFGFGTCSAAQIFETNRIIQEIEKNEKEEFEVLVYSDVIKDWVQKPKLIKSYKL